MLLVRVFLFALMLYTRRYANRGYLVRYTKLLEIKEKNRSFIVCIGRYDFPNLMKNLSTLIFDGFALVVVCKWLLYLFYAL